MKSRVAMIQIFSHREPALLITGRAISNLGDGVANVALSLTVYALAAPHQRAADLGYFGAARLIPMVAFILIGGVIVDRFSRRTLMLISDVGRCVLVAAVATLAATGHLQFWHLLCMAFLFGAFDAVFMPASTALIPQIVPEELLGAMNAIRPLSNNVMANMAGPALGGLIAAHSTSVALYVDAASFALSAVALALMRPTERPARSENSSMLKEILEGVAYVRRTTWIWTTLAVVTFTNALIFTPMFTFIPFFLLHDLHASKAYVGYSFAVTGFAGMIGTLIVGSRATPRRRVRVMWISWLISLGAIFIFAAATNVWELFVVLLVMSPTLIYGNVIWESMLQSEVPRELLGRVSALDWFASMGLAPAGLVIVALAISAFGVRSYFAVAAAISVVPSVVLLVSRRVNSVDRDRVDAESPEPDG